MTTSRRVVITGVGTVNALAADALSTYERLSTGNPRVEKRQLQEMPGRSREYCIATPDADSTERLTERAKSVLAELGYSAHRDLAFTIAALEEALSHSDYAFPTNDNTLGAILSFEAPGMERTVATLFEGLAGGAPVEMTSLIERLGEAFYRTQAFVMTHVVGKCFKLHGFTTCVSNACSSGLHALDLAAGMIRDGRAEAMFVAGGEHFETGVRLAYFGRQGFYSGTGDVRPYVKPATGFIVGEGAAALLLESNTSAVARGADVLCEVFPAAFAQQSWHQTLPNVRDRRLQGVIRTALQFADTPASSVDLTVAHGAATGVSDEYELDCINRAMEREEEPIVVGFKGLTGHMLGASAIVDLAILAKALGRARLPVTEVTARRTADLPCRTALKVATGFTGHDAAVVLKSVKIA
ncbi:MAG: beta-ketoacyl synthase [Planctomycetota bacterium]|nr:beta-ketoacyl synthase [Planctomycetota bacterium]